MSNIWTMLEEFHDAFNLGNPDKVDLPQFDNLKELQPHLLTIMRSIEYLCDHLPTYDRRSLRIKLLLEEVAEYLEAEVANDTVEIADALTDIIYIAAGTEVEYGIPGEDIFLHIHENNMSKLGPEGKPIYREDGKVMKPDGYQPPNIDQFIRE